MSTKKYSFIDHPEHKKLLKQWNDEHGIAAAMRTQPLTDSERETVHKAILGLYEAAKLEAPKNVVFARGPITGAIAASIAAGVWYLREHFEEHQALFGRIVSEQEIQAAIPIACRRVIDSAMRELEFKLPPPPIATRAATDFATYTAINAATRAVTDDATRIATYTAIAAETATKTAFATYAAINVATRAVTDDATYAATRAVTDDATRIATYTAIAAETATKTATAIAAEPVDAIADATDNATDRIARFLILCTSNWIQFRNGGNQWSGWISYLSFFRDVAKIGDSHSIDYTKWKPYEQAAIAGPRFMHARFCIVSDLPNILRIDEQNRPHSENGPSHRWDDGIELHFWHGTRIPSEWIKNRKILDPKIALTWSNIEQRRAAAELIGWARVLEQLKPHVIDTDVDPQIGQLLEVDLPDAPKERFLRVRCATNRDFVIPVPSSMKTALEANAATFDISPDLLCSYGART